MKRKKEGAAFFALLLVYFIVFVLSGNNDSSPSKPEDNLSVTGTVPILAIDTSTVLENSAFDWYLVSRVVDGDTIELSNGQKVRYIGVNTPESVDPRRPVQCFGKEAALFNKNLVEGKRIRLEKDVSDTDRYGRLLRYVYLEDGTFVNLKLISGGNANVMTIPPDVSKAKIFLSAEQTAREAGLGLWGKCP